MSMTLIKCRPAGTDQLHGAGRASRSRAALLPVAVKQTRCSLVLFVQFARSFAHVHLHDRSTRIRRLMLYLYQFDQTRERTDASSPRWRRSQVNYSYRGGAARRRNTAHLVRFRHGRRTGTQGQQTKQNINLKGNSTENVEVTQNGSTAKGQQNRHIIKKGNRIEADLSGTQPHHNSSTVLGSILHSTSYGQIRQIVPMLQEVLSFIH